MSDREYNLEAENEILKNKVRILEEDSREWCNLYRKLEMYRDFYYNKFEKIKEECNQAPMIDSELSLRILNIIEEVNND